MSFLKKLFQKSPDRWKKKCNNKTVAELRGTDGEGEPRSRSPRRGSHSRSRSNSPSPSPSPKIPAISHSAVSTTHTPDTNTTTVGVRLPSNRHVAQVLPGLLLGSQEIAQDLHALERYKVTHVLNTTEEVENSFPEKFVYKRINIPDRTSINIEQYFEECFSFIDNANANGGVVLVHCYYGASRSASIVIGYLIQRERMRYHEALEYLQILRPGVNPNDGFEKQLRQFELQVL